MLGDARAPVAIGAPASEPISIIGIVSTPTGIGEGARLAGTALAALGYDVRNVDISSLLTGAAYSRERPARLEEGPGTAILHFNPDNLPAIITLLGRRRLRGKRIVGYWAWELPRIPQGWLNAFAEVDEIWTPSRFVADAVRTCTDKTVRVVHHPVALGLTGSSRRDHFEFGDRFVVLTMFSCSSSFARKNPVAAVEAFRRAFGESSRHLLVIKVSDGADAPEDMAELCEAINGAPNIRIEQRRLDDRERLDLIASADVLISLHRSEGFGLVMAEAMLARVPVVATDWSGNLDYMDGKTALLIPSKMIEALDRKGIYANGECWADADIEMAAASLRRLAEGGPEIVEMVNAAHRLATERLGLPAFAATIREAIGLPSGTLS